MLASHEPSGSRPDIHLQLHTEPLQKLLGHLLQEWDYQLVSEPTSQTLQLCENDQHLSLQDGQGQILARLSLPFELPQLYQVLASQLPDECPEQQLRIRVSLPLTVFCRGDEYLSETRMLSDRSLRFSLPHELARGEHLELQLLLGDRSYRLSAEVIYVLPGKELGWGERVDIGVIFRPLAGSTRQYILDWLLGCCLQRLEALLTPDDLQAALPSLQLPLNSLGMLKG